MFPPHCVEGSEDEEIIGSASNVSGKDAGIVGGRSVHRSQCEDACAEERKT